MSYAPTMRAPVEGIEPPLTVLETAALPLSYTDWQMGFRPVCHRIC